jgi:hypothetical protein
MGGHRNRINGIMRTRTMASTTVNLDREILTEGRLRTGCQPEFAGGGCGIYVKRNDRGNVIERSAGNHLACTMTNFLGRLKIPRHATGVSRQTMRVEFQQDGGGASWLQVHHPSVGERTERRFPDRKRVEIARKAPPERRSPSCRKFP